MRLLCVLSSLLSATALKQQGEFLLRATPRAHQHEAESKFLVDAPDALKRVTPWEKFANIDSVSRATHGLLDNFFVIYWGCVLLCCAMVILREAYHAEPEHPLYSGKSDGSDQSNYRPASRWKRSSSLLCSKSCLATRTVDPDFWSLCLVSIHGQVWDWKGRRARPLSLHLLASCMGLMQLSALALILSDIDPNAIPGLFEAPWVKSGKSVNCMKLIMVLFLSLSVITEACRAYRNFVSAALFVPKGDDPQQTLCAVLFSCLRYFIALCTILGGVAVILSCQQVTCILYKSLAILFISQFGEVVYKFCYEMFGFRVDWTIPAADWNIATWKSKLLRQIVMALPMLWGISLIGRACYTNMMPLSVMLSSQGASAILRFLGV